MAGMFVSTLIGAGLVSLFSSAAGSASDGVYGSAG